jgi:hypothetical protein
MKAGLQGDRRAAHWQGDTAARRMKHRLEQYAAERAAKQRKRRKARST